MKSLVQKSSKVFLTLVSAVFLLGLFSCATLQQDIFISSEDNAYIYSSIEYYETSFIKIDSEYALSQDIQSDAKSLLEELNTYITNSHVAEPVLLARLTALKGLLQEMTKNKSAAENSYKQAASLQGSDRYVLLLSIRLEKDIDKKLTLTQNILNKDSENPVILLEKAKLLIKKNDYKNSLALIDDAFMIFTKENLEIYNDVYRPVRSYVWDLYTIGNNQNTDAANLNEILNLNLLVELTASNTKLLDNYKSKSKTKTQDLIEVLRKERYFNNAKDYSGTGESYKDILESESISKKLCARFFWNLYVRKYGNQEMLTKYSERYKNRTKSPIGDIALDDSDFDAVLGVIENEIMELPDGKNFLPDENVTVMDYLKWVKKIEK
ncbi:MAG: hypothetical protein K6A89_05535 [Treponema sp.]|nr:hypothetical protein [Treponema sp.]